MRERERERDVEDRKSSQLLLIKQNGCKQPKHILFTCTALANARAKEVLSIAQNDFIPHSNITDNL